MKKTNYLVSPSISQLSNHASATPEAINQSFPIQSALNNQKKQKVQFNIGKVLIVGMLFFAMMLSGSGCSSVNTEQSGSDSVVESSPNALQRQGLAFSRIMLSPLNMLGFTCAECKNIGAASVILFPIISCWSVPAGALSMSADIVTGFFEMLFWQQFSSVKYPWDSFDYKVAKPWCEATKTMLIVAMAVAGAAGQNEIANSGGSYDTGTNTNESSAKKNKVMPRIKHSSCGGTGICNICKGKGTVGTLKCSGCGGNGICRPCHGTGYAN